MTEREIQKHLFDWCVARQHRICIPNFHLFGESDFVSVTRTGVIYEFEIKITLADFKVDAKKDKHGHYIAPTLSQFSKWIPHRFYYAVPRELSESVLPLLPGHAGLVTVAPDQVLISHKAPTLHKEPISQALLMRMACSMTHRFVGPALYRKPAIVKVPVEEGANCV